VPFLWREAIVHVLDIIGLNLTETYAAEDFATENEMFGSPVAALSGGQHRAFCQSEE